jgi:hypothetical protein
MLDWVPAQVWLLLLIGFVAYRPAKAVFKDVQSFRTFGNFEFTPSRDPSRNRSLRFRVCVVALIVLVALAVFIFTPQAEAFARSPDFVPTLLGFVAVFLAFMTANDLTTGKAVPLVVRGDFGPYARADQPGRYWSSIAANAGLALLLAYSAINFWQT